MINGDRLLRVIYREANVNELFFLEKGVDGVNPQNLDEFLENIERQFSLNNSNFVSKLADKYLSVYPSNYHKQDVELMICRYKNLACSKYPKLKSNALCIILYFAEQLLIQNNDEIQVRFDKLLEWDGFANKIDCNVMLASFTALKSCRSFLNNTPSILKTDNDRLYESLSGIGASENHMHLFGSGYGSEINLNNFMAEPFFNETIYDKFCDTASTSVASLGLHEVDNKLHLIKFKFLKLFLTNYDKIKSDNVFHPNIRECFKILSARSMDEISIFSKMINQMQTDITEKYESAVRGNLDTNYKLEREFLCKNIDKILINSDDLTLIYFFNTYIAMLSKFKFEFVQDNIGKGFSKFKEKERQKNLFAHLNNEDENIAKSVFDKYYKENFVNNIECRVTPEKINIKFYDKLSQINHGMFLRNKQKMTRAKEINIALICHFIKPNNAKLSPIFSRNIDLKDKYMKELSKISSALRNINDKDKMRVVAIDTANYETYCRPEVFGECYRRIRMEYPNLHFTYHVGEDFPTIANGLRAIYETIEFLGYERGDRIGHAIALGIDVKKSAELKRKEFFENLQDYVDDIAWMYYIITAYFPDEYKLSVYLEEEFRCRKVQLFENINLSDFSIVNYFHSLLLRSDSHQGIIKLFDNPKFKNNIEESFKFNNTKQHEEAKNDNKAVELTLNYFFNKKLFKNGNEVYNAIEISEKYIQCVELCQIAVKNMIIEQGIAIETNPSSNKKISATTKYDELPLFEFNHFGLKGFGEGKNIPVSVNTDDSAIFQSNLSNEYALVLSALCRKKDLDPESAYAYIEYLCKASNTQNFVKRK